MIDAKGYPLPIHARAVALTDAGFSLDLPGWLPWNSGKATLPFEGLEILIGDVVCDGVLTEMTVERTLPVLPLMANPSEILRPCPATKQALMDRIAHELTRRGAQLPVMPPSPPEPTAGAKFRAEAAYSFKGLSGIRDD